jgi:23S rRNA (guanine745-N1)-methyltransferase
VTLVCPVRDCRQPLERAERRYVCPNAHSFDVARSGYVNLLQPQDRRSKEPGDTAAAVAARRTFLDRGHVRPLVDAVVRALPMSPGQALLDAGCGEGHHLAAFRSAYAIEGCGVDISIPAIDLAARRHRELLWIVANADRLLPFGDASFDAVMSITARMNPDEFRRVLRPDGRLLVVIPGADDLVELREIAQGERVERDRTERTVDLFAPRFELAHHEHVAHRTTLDRESIDEVMSSSYRGLRARERERLAQIDSAEVTLSRDVILFRAR